MAFGAEVYGDNGKLQIGGEGVATFQLVQKGTGTAGTGTFFDVAPTVAYDALAIKSSFGVVPKSIFPTTQASGTVQRIRKFSSIGDDLSYTYYAFRSYRVMTPSSSGVGIEIYNPDGTVSFSSVQPQLLKVIKVPVTSYPLFSTAVSASQTYAFLSYGTVCHKITATEPMGGGTFLVSCYPTVWQDSATSISIRTDLRCSRTSSTPEGYHGGILIANVTGY